MSLITPSAVKELFAARAIRSARIESISSDSFVLVFSVAGQLDERTLQAKKRAGETHERERVFRSLDAAANMARALGFTELTLKLDKFKSGQGDLLVDR